jgi:hypothetical protein
MFIFILTEATHKQVRFGTVELQRGQFCTGRHQLCAALGLTEQKARTCLKHLHELGMITSESTNRFTVYTVVNYNNYQDFKDNQPTEQQTDNKQITNEQQTDNKQITTIQEHKHINTQEQKKETKTNAQLALLTECGIPEKLALQWLEIRKLKKLVLNETALEQTKMEAQKVDFTLLEAITKCCAESWGGFKASWVINQDSPKNGTSRKSTQDNFETKNYGSEITLL